MCILCKFTENWERRYDRVRYPPAFFNYFLEQIKACQNPNDLFTCLLHMLQWKLGLVREGRGVMANTMTISNTPFTWSDNNRTEDFKKYRKDIDFLRRCFEFRNGVIEGYEFFKYLREEKRIFGKGLVLHIFLLHLLKPEKYPIIDQHVWRAMEVFQGIFKLPLAAPEKWDDYEKYRNFFNDFFESLCSKGRIRFNKQVIDRALMTFGKWIKGGRKKRRISRENIEQIQPKRGDIMGKCPSCGSPLVWRRAQRTGELYRGCTNFRGGCRWQDRSY